MTHASSISKIHDAGVTAISCNPLREHVLATGSYDENVRIWDTRNFKTPVSTLGTGGGVWRLKWHHADPELLLAACMYNGFQVLKIDDEGSATKVLEYRDHESIAYGCDWSRDKLKSGERLVGTCSFYDHSFNLWTFNS